MNILLKTADNLASTFVPFYKWGKPMAIGVSQGNLQARLMRTGLEIGYHTFVTPLVRQAIFSIPPVRNAILGTGQYLGGHAGKAAQSWVSRSVQTAASKELQKDPKITDDIKNRLQNIVAAATGPTIETNNVPHMKHLAEQMTVNLLGACAISQVAGQTTGRLVNIPAAPLPETTLYSLVLNAFNLYCLPRLGTTDEDMEKLKVDFQNQLLESIKDPTQPLSPEFQNCLNNVFNKIADTIVEHPTTNLAALKEAVAKAAEKPAAPVEPELKPEPKKALLAKIVDFFSAILQFLMGLIFRKKEEEPSLVILPSA